VSERLEQTTPPSEKELVMLRSLDPTRMYLG